MSAQVFSAWTSMSSLPEPVKEFQRESTLQENSESSKELPLMNLSNGSPRRWQAPSSDEA